MVVPGRAVTGPGGPRDYPFGWILRPDDGRALGRDGSPPARPEASGSAPGAARRAEAAAGHDAREAHRTAGAHARPGSGPGAADSRHPPATGPGALTPRTGGRTDGRPRAVVRRFAPDPAVVVSLALLVAMLVFAVTWFLRILG